MRKSTFAGRFFGAALLLACALGGANASASQTSLLRPWPARLAPPPLVLDDLNGRQWTLAGLRGKVVVLNFWASWCGPCVEELPRLNALAGRADQVAVIGINYKEASWTVKKFASEHAFRFPVLLDKNGAQFKRWTTGVMPTTVLIGRDGRPRWRLTGSLAAGDGALRAALHKLLAEAPAP